VIQRLHLLTKVHSITLLNFSSALNLLIDERTQSCLECTSLFGFVRDDLRNDSSDFYVQPDLFANQIGSQFGVPPRSPCS